MGSACPERRFPCHAGDLGVDLSLMTVFANKKISVFVELYKTGGSGGKFEGFIGKHQRFGVLHGCRVTAYLEIGSQDDVAIAFDGLFEDIVRIWIIRGGPREDNVEYHRLGSFLCEPVKQSGVQASIPSIVARIEFLIGCVIHIDQNHFFRNGALAQVKGKVVAFSV